LECMLFIARSLERRALPYALNRPPRAAASFNKGVERMGASRSGQPQFERQWRLAPTAHTC
jgi:hypothetical protein